MMTGRRMPKGHVWSRRAYSLYVDGEEWSAAAATDVDAMRAAEMQSDNSRDDRAGPAHKGPVGHGGKGTRDRSELYAKLGFSLKPSFAVVSLFQQPAAFAS